MLFILTFYFYADTWLVFYGLLQRQRLDIGLAQSVYKALLGLGDEFKSNLLGGSHLSSQSSAPKSQSARPKK